MPSLPYRSFGLVLCLVFGLLSRLDGKTCSDARNSGLLVKEPVEDLPSSFLGDVIAAVKAMKTQQSAYDARYSAYDYFVYLHVLAAGPVQVHSYFPFVSWHREMTFRFDNEIRRVSGNPELYWPYWNFFESKSTRAFFSDSFLGPITGNPAADYQVETGPFADFPVNVSLNLPGLPAEQRGHLSRAGGNGLFTCLKVGSDPISTPYLLDATNARQSLLGQSALPFGPFVPLVTGGPNLFLNVDPNQPQCDWEDPVCIWHFIDQPFTTRLLCRHYGATLPSLKEVKCLYNRFPFTTAPGDPSVPVEYFSHCVEGVDPSDSFSFPIEALGIELHPPHGGAHQYIGGSVAQASASNDPAFFGIHGNIDRLWAEWQLQNAENLEQAQLDWELPGFPGVRVKDTLSTVTYNYTYDTVACATAALLRVCLGLVVGPVLLSALLF